MSRERPSNSPQEYQRHDGGCGPLRQTGTRRIRPSGQHGLDLVGHLSSPARPDVRQLPLGGGSPSGRSSHALRRSAELPRQSYGRTGLPGTRGHVRRPWPCGVDVRRPQPCCPHGRPSPADHLNTAAVPSQIDTIERAVLAIRDAFEHIDERAVGRARNEDAGDAMSVFDQSDFFVSGVLRYAGHSLDIRAQVLPALIAGRRFIVEAATKAGLRKTTNEPIQWTFTEE